MGTQTESPRAGRCARKVPKQLLRGNTPGLPKKDKGTAPLDHRMLAIFSALYRIEAGAWYDHIFPWLRTILHKDMAGAIPDMEALDIAWDAQARIENALLNEISLTMVSYDFISSPTLSSTPSLVKCFCTWDFLLRWSSLLTT